MVIITKLKFPQMCPLTKIMEAVNPTHLSCSEVKCSSVQTSNCLSMPYHVTCGRGTGDMDGFSSVPACKELSPMEAVDNYDKCSEHR